MIGKEFIVFLAIVWCLLELYTKKNRSSNDGTGEGFYDSHCDKDTDGDCDGGDGGD